LNLRFLAVAVVLLALPAVGVHFLHGYQVQRSSHLLLRQATEAETAGDHLKSAGYLRRYLALDPQSTDALVRLGIALDENGKKTKADKDRMQALMVLEQGARRDPDRVELHRRLVDLNMDYGDFLTAKHHFDALQRKNYVDDAALLKLKGDWELAANKDAGGKYAQAAQWYSLALAKAPADLDLYVKLAELYRSHLQDTPAADLLMLAMVNQNAKSYQAHLVRAKYLLKFAAADAEPLPKEEAAKFLAGKFEEANTHLDTANALSPNAIEVVLTRANLAMVRRDLTKARAILQDGLKTNPKHIPLYMAMIAIEVQEGRWEEGLAVAQRGLQALPEQPELLQALAGLLLRKGDIAEADRVAARLDKTKYSAAAKEMLKAQVAFRQGKWGEAAARLDAIRPHLTERTALEADVLLGQCHERLGNPDQALTYYQQALKADPVLIPARVGVATAKLSLGRTDEAVAAYRQALLLAPSAQTVRLALARVLILKTLRLPPEGRDWKEVADELKALDKENVNDTEVVLLKADFLLYSDRAKGLDRALDLLQTARKEHPDRAELWVALANLTALRAGTPTAGVPAALKVLDEATAQPGLEKAFELKLARIALVRYLPPEEARPALNAVAAGLPADARGGRGRVQLALIAAYLGLNAWPETERVCSQLAREQPDNLAAWLILFDLHLRTGNSGGLDQALEAMRRVEAGQDGPYWNYAQALRLVRQGKADAKQLARARKHLDDAAKRRWSWAAIPTLRAAIDELEGKKHDALDHYRTAVRLGESRPDVLHKFARLLVEEHRDAELQQLLTDLAGRQHVLVSAGLGKLAADLLLETNSADAIKLAEKTVQNSKDYFDFIWLGQLYWKAGRPEARQTLEAACDLQPKAPEPYRVLIAYLVSTGDHQAAEAVVVRAAEQLTGPDTAAGLAACHELVGHLEKAEKLYLAALDANRKDVAVSKVVITFYLRSGQGAKAEKHLRFLLLGGLSADAEQLAWARRNLARVLASTRDFGQFNKALALLEENRKARPGELDDQRARAAVLATRMEHRKEAIRLLEEILAKQHLEPLDRWILVLLYDADGQAAKCRTALETLLKSPGVNDPAFFAFYIRRALRDKDLARAQPWLDRLDKAEPQALRTFELKALALVVQEKDQQAIALLVDYARRHEAELSQVARLLEKLAETSRDKTALFAKAEELYRRCLAGTPAADDYLNFAEFLGARDRIGEALDQCEAARKKGSPEAAAQGAVFVLRLGKHSAEDLARVEGWLREGIDKSKTPAHYQLLLTDYFDLRGDYAQAIKTLRELLGTNPKHGVALNNLAWLVAVKERRGVEGMLLIEEAIAANGRRADFLDTKGVCSLVSQRPADAVEALTQAVEIHPAPMYYFHLALAHLDANNKNAARTALAQARALGLVAADIHPLERADYDRVVAALEKK
jgi:tetratricopeptide (TPR) repeat protein